MILIGIGSNLPSERAGSPLETCEAAMTALAGDESEIQIAARSPWYRSRPVPASEQPWFVNAVARIETDLEPVALLDRLHLIEDRFGRRRGSRNEARVLDLDLLAYDDRVSGRETSLNLPHKRLHERLFVLAPLNDIAPDWRHPVLNVTAAELLSALALGQIVERMDVENSLAAGEQSHI